MDFEIVTRADVPSKRRGGRPPTPVSLAIEAGQVVFLPGGTLDTTRTYVNVNGYLRKRDIKVSRRSGEHNGVSGVFVWRADLDAE